MKRRLFAIIVAMTMIISILPVTALAEDLMDPLPDNNTETQIDSADLSETEEGEANSLPEPRGGVITLTGDVTLTESWEAETGATITLDLNGHTLSGPESSPVIKNFGTLTIQDTSEEQDGKITGYRGVDNYGTLRLNSGTIEGTNENTSGGWSGSVFIYADDTSFTMNGGTISGGIIPSIDFNPNANMSGFDSTEIMILGGSLGTIALKGNAAELTIGSTDSENNDIHIDAITTPAGNKSYTINLNGGTIGLLPANDNVTYTGFESLITDTTNCPGGFHFASAGDEGYKLVQNTDPVAKIGDTSYYYLPDAVAALKENDTLMLTADYNITNSSEALTIEAANVTIDLNGHKITVTGDVSNPPITCKAKTGTFKITNSGSEAAITPVTGKNYTVPAVQISSGSAATVEVETDDITLTNGIRLTGGRIADIPANRELVAADGDYDGLCTVTFGTDGAAEGYIYAFGDLDAIAGQAGEGVTAATVTLLGDADTAMKYSTNEIAMTVDLADHTVTASSGNSLISIPDGADETTLTVKNGTINAQSISAASVLAENCTLTLEDLAMTSGGDFGIATNGSATGSTGSSAGLKLTLTNCSLQNTTDSESGTVGIYFPVHDGTLTIDNSQITQFDMGVQAISGSTTITGNQTVITGSGRATENDSGDGPRFDGAALSVLDREGYGDLVTVKIEAGSFSTPADSDYGAVHVSAFKNDQFTGDFENNEDGTQTVQVSGGTFSAPIDPELCETGSAPLVKADGSCSIITQPEDGSQKYIEQDGTYYENEDALAATHVAKVGDKYYSTMEEAIKAVGEGGTIYVIKDIPNATGISVPTDKNFTLDFGGHIYTLSGPGAGSTNTETNGFQLLKGSDITFKNGTIRIAKNANNIKRIIQNYADLTLEDMHIYAENQVGGEEYALSFNFGNIVFKGDTDIITTDDDTAVFDVYFWNNTSYQDGVSVTFDETYTGTINGTIIYDSTDSDKAALIIQGSGYIGAVDTSNSTNNGNNIKISGGSFGESVAEYVVDELNAELNSDGIYTYYETIEEALEQAEAGDTITDLSSQSGDSPEPVQVVTVTYNSNGHGEAPEGHKVTAGTEITLKDMEDTDDYAFMGWSIGEETYQPGEIFSVTGNTTFTAVWARKTTPIIPSDKVGYIVEHYLEGRWGYELEDTEFFTGKIRDTVTAQPKDYPGYRYNERISTASGTLIAIEDEGDIVILKLYYDERTPSRPSGGSSEPSYTVSVEDLVNGTVETDPRRAQEGEEVTITVTPDDGYELDTLTVIDRDGDEVEVTEERDGTFTFEMPDSRVTIEATFVPVAEDIAPEIPTDWSNPYGDVAANAWYYDAVAYVTANGLMNGTSATTFAPDATTTRAMIWTVLARMNGQSVDGGTPWYALAQSWAMRANVSDGTNPESAISREELATMLYRAAGSPAVSGNLLSYPDGSSVSAWAESAMLWATQNGIISGIDGMLTPQGQATRAQVATMLMRFREVVIR